jgi:hypothetical protein
MLRSVVDHPASRATFESGVCRRCACQWFGWATDIETQTGLACVWLAILPRGECVVDSRGVATECDCERKFEGLMVQGTHRPVAVHALPQHPDSDTP